MRASFDDNCYDMTPGIQRSIGVKLEKPLKPSELRRRLQFIFYH